MARDDRVLRGWLVALGVYHLALGLLMALSPGTFFDKIGPFGHRNDHYIRDVSTFYFALGVVTLMAVRRPSWRVPVLAFAALEYSIHALNHLVDIGDADPSALGPFDFVSITIVAGILVWLLGRAARERRAGRIESR